MPLKWERKIGINPYVLIEDLAIPANDYWQSNAGMTELVNRANAINAAGTETVLECTYSGPGYDRSERYWYQKRPAQADVGELSAIQPDHLLLSIRPPVASCPSYWEGKDQDWEIRRNQGASRRAMAKRDVDLQVLRPGSGDNPNIRDTVQLSLVGTTANGQVVDRAGSTSMVVSEAGPPMAVALQRMQRGGTYAVTLTPDLDGDKFRARYRPPNVAVRYEIALLDFGSPAQPSSSPNRVLPSQTSGGQTASEHYASFEGEWRGTYRCAGRTSGATIVFESGEAGALIGSFSFYPIAGDRQTLAGSFRMSGTAQAGGSSVRMYPTGWISRPPNYQALSMQLQLASSGNVITGFFPTQPGCTSLRVSRIG